jgi:hypothetical protein
MSGVTIAPPTTLREAHVESDSSQGLMGLAMRAAELFPFRKQSMQVLERNGQPTTRLLSNMNLLAYRGFGVID